MRRSIACAGLALALLLAGHTGRADSPTSLLVLVGLDGFRWDYVDRYDAPTLRFMARRGVRAEGLVPPFPSKTFPSHYTQVTGLQPARHGIISNNMVDPDIPGRFALAARDVMADTRWWGGEPIWVTASKHGVRSATMFWPGSEFEIAGSRPTYWRAFDARLSNAARTRQVIEWMRLPDDRRPRLFTLYFDEVDGAGHRFGPESPAVARAVKRVDREIARLLDGIADAGLQASVNVLVTSDHGMAALSPSRRIYLDDYVPLSSVEVRDLTPLLGVAPRGGTVDDLYRALAGRHPALHVYRRDDLPAEYGLAGHRRLAPIVGLADEGWTITTRDRIRRKLVLQGEHGYSPTYRSMHGIFVAEGPGLRQGLSVPAFEGVHVYELLCALLGLPPAPNDGRLDATASIRR